MSQMDGGDVLWSDSHSYLSLRRGDSTAHIRMDSVNRESMEAYFNPGQALHQSGGHLPSCKGNDVLMTLTLVIDAACAFNHLKKMSGRKLGSSAPVPRWLHEDCVLDCIVDSSGKEKLCPYCCT